MLDNNLIEQLKSVYENLTSSITLSYDKSTHSKQNELVDMLTQVASTSDKIKTNETDNESSVPHFEILKEDNPVGISFTGIPGGHEFTSLVLGILNSDLKGKLPDEMITNRIRNLSGKINLKTYISLSCENCPEVVQALNIMAIFNDNITHEMIDGEFAQEEISSLNIQGVPSVVADGELIHSGKSDLTNLLNKLEDKFGADELEARDLGNFDVVVVGGGPAGISSAIYTTRKGLKTAVITDKVGGQMQETKGIENFISVPYTEGPELSAALAKHASEYDIKLLEHRRVKSIENGLLKNIVLNSNETLKAKSVIIATGAKWKELGIEGEKEYLGRGVAFCPHCDGPYYKGKNISVIGGGNSGVEAAIDLAAIVNKVTLVEFLPELNADEVLVKKLKELPNVEILTNAKTSKIVGDGDKVTSIEVESRSSGESSQIELDGVFVQIGLAPNSEIFKKIVETNSYGEIMIDDKCRTSTSKIYAAGDVTTVPYKQIIISMGEGAKAGLAAFEDLVLK
jgi:alkyl hydroperoxide reductase subunit F